ncbi:MAG: PH domain-containing protein, partial [Parascardovia denticolens]
MEKFSPFLILSRLWHHAFSSATAIAGLMASILAFHGTARVVLEVISLYYLFTRFYLLFYDWLTTRYQVTDTGLILRKGFITRRQIHVAWKDIKSVSESADPILRWKHLSSATLSQMTDSTGEIKLYAIPYTQLERIKKLVGESISSKATNLSKDENRPKTESTSNGTDALPAQDSSVESSVVEDSAKNKAKSQRITRKLRLGDYFLIGFTYAQFII